MAKSLAEINSALSTAVAAMTGDATTTADAIQGLIEKIDASNAAIHQSIDSVRVAFDALLSQLTANGQVIDSQLSNAVAAIVVPDFDAAAPV